MASRARWTIDKPVDERRGGCLHWNRPPPGVVGSVKEEIRWMGSGNGRHGPLVSPP
jgi:hypothetical protein